MSRNRESGYALLFIYAMAAVIAIMLFMELPRAAFEAQRDREQLLVDRGEQYSRAVTLYVRKFNTYPPSMEALDSTQNLRFLRNHYVDPMTGKDEWRLIHVGPGGVFTDSLVYGKKKDGDKKSEPQNFITELAPTGGNQDPQGAVNLAARQRPSDQPGAPGDPNNQQSNLPAPQPVNTPQPGLTAFGMPQVDVNGQPVAINPMQQGGFPGQTPPGQTPFYGNQQAPGVQQPPGTVQSSPFQTGQAANSQPSPAGTNLINQLLTSPRPGGAPPGIAGMPQGGQPAIDQYGNPVPANPLTGTPNATPGFPAAAPAQAGPQVVGGGIAGVASKREQEGIKLYKEKKKYNEWEFVYDITKDPTRTVSVPGAAPNAGNALGASGATAQQPQTQQTLQQAQQQAQQQMQLFNQQQIQQQQQQQFPQPNAPVPPPFSPGMPPPGIPPTGPGMPPPPPSQ